MKIKGEKMNYKQKLLIMQDGLKYWNPELSNEIIILNKMLQFAYKSLDLFHSTKKQDELIGILFELIENHRQKHLELHPLFDSLSNSLIELKSLIGCETVGYDHCIAIPTYSGLDDPKSWKELVSFTSYNKYDSGVVVERQVLLFSFIYALRFALNQSDFNKDYVNAFSIHYMMELLDHPDFSILSRFQNNNLEITDADTCSLYFLYGRFYAQTEGGRLC